MIDKTLITEILDTYKRYGWILRRVLLTQQLKTAIGGDSRTLFGGVPVIASDIDAVWFSRPPQSGSTAWEVRHLSSNPYALLEHIDETSADFEEKLGAVETRLRAAARRSL
jgi:hypothetical protein